MKTAEIVGATHCQLGHVLLQGGIAFQGKRGELLDLPGAVVQLAPEAGHIVLRLAGPMLQPLSFRPAPHTHTQTEFLSSWRWSLSR